MHLAGGPHIDAAVQPKPHISSRTRVSFGVSVWAKGMGWWRVDDWHVGAWCRSMASGQNKPSRSFILAGTVLPLVCYPLRPLLDNKTNVPQPRSFPSGWSRFGFSLNVLSFGNEIIVFRQPLCCWRLSSQSIAVTCSCRAPSSSLLPPPLGVTLPYLTPMQGSGPRSRHWKTPPFLHPFPPKKTNCN